MIVSSSDARRAATKWSPTPPRWRNDTTPETTVVHGSKRLVPDLNKRRNVEQSYRRVARLGDGWMTTWKSPEDVQTSLAMIRGYAREMGHELKPDFEVAIYHNINVNEDRDQAFAESKRFLDSYYSVDYHQDRLKLWVAAGSPAQCIQSLQRYVDAGATTILLRVTGYDEKRQFKRVTEEVLPAFG